MVADVLWLVNVFTAFCTLFILLAACAAKKKADTAAALSRTSTAPTLNAAPNGGGAPSTTSPAVSAAAEGQKPAHQSGSGSSTENKPKNSKMRPPEKVPSNDNLDNRAVWANKVAKRKCKEISQEHKEKLKGYTAPGKTYKAHDSNPLKNRYTDVMCIDSTRVVLKGRKDDYIHASWIHIPDKSTSYICTQGPMAETVHDFWAMVHQEKAKFVIMLCNLVESGGEKCALYYPEKSGVKEKYDDYDVEVIEEKPEPVEGVVWNIISIHHKGEAHEVYHVIVPWWPDQLAPADAKPMVKLYKWVKKLNPKGSPIVVHCSAGVGRTATFVGIDYANVRLQEPNIELLDVIKEMRSMRYQSIQSHVQYLFLHVCLMEYFIQEGIVKRNASIDQFIDQYRMHALKKLEKRRGEDDDNHDKQKDDEKK